MSVEAMESARKVKTGGVTQKAVLMAIANYADEHMRSWPSQARLASDIEANERTVARALADLEKKGLISRKRRHRTDGTRTSDMITLTLTDNMSPDKSSPDNLSKPTRQSVQTYLTESHPNEPSVEPSGEPSERKTRVAACRNTVPKQFGEFWAAYPNKVGKPAGRKAFIAASKRASFTAIMAGLQRYIAKTDDRPWCNPATWLNQDRWDDEPATPPPRQARSITAGEAKRQERDDAYNNWMKQDDAPNDITEPQGRIAALIEGAVNRG